MSKKGESNVIEMFLAREGPESEIMPLKNVSYNKKIYFT